MLRVDRAGHVRYAGVMPFQELFQSIVQQAGAKTIYGAPISAEGRTIVPVAKIVYGFGGGSGKPQDDPSRAPGGGGGGFVGKPVGVVEVSREGTRFIPIAPIPSRPLVLALGIGICLGLLLAKKTIDVRVRRYREGAP